MFSFMLAILLVPVDFGNTDDVYSRSVPCCGLVAFEGEKSGGTRRPNQRKVEPTGKEIAAQAREAEFNNRLAKTSKQGKTSITVTPARFSENTKLESFDRGMVVGEIQSKGVHGVPDGKSSLFVSAFDGKHHAYVVHEGRIVNKSIAVLRNSENKVESASVSLTSEPGDVSPITICGRKWCVEIKIKKKGS